jgi:leucyl aminopeptidase
VLFLLLLILFFRRHKANEKDDDGSGAMTTLETFRVLASDPNFKPTRPVEFHWYSAEELGLLGSQPVAASYKKSGKKIVGMLQNDMTGTYCSTCPFR